MPTIPMTLPYIIVHHMDPDDHGPIPPFNPNLCLNSLTFRRRSSGDPLRLIPVPTRYAINDLVYYAELDRYTNFVPQLNGRYLSSNANITVFNSDGEVVSVPVGSE